MATSAACAAAAEDEDEGGTNLTDLRWWPQNDFPGRAGSLQVVTRWRLPLYTVHWHDDDEDDEDEGEVRLVCLLSAIVVSKGERVCVSVCE